MLKHVLRLVLIPLVLMLALVVETVPPPARAAGIAVYQQCSGAASSGTTATATCTGTSVIGDTLWAAIGSTANSAVTLPTGWHSLSANHAATYGGYLIAYARVDVVGVASSYAFTVGSGAWSTQIYEISGSDLNLAFHVPGAPLLQTTTNTSWSAIGSVTGHMIPSPAYIGLSFIIGNASAGSTVTPTQSGSGWSADTQVTSGGNSWIQPYHGSDTTNSIYSTTAVSLGTTNTGVAINLLVPQTDVGAGLQIERSVGTNNTAGSASPAFTFVGGVPVAGDLILVHMTFSATATSATFTCPTGWTCLDNYGSTQPNTTGPPGIVSLYRIAQTGDTATYTWTSAFSGSQDYTSWAAEIANESRALPINGHSYVQNGASGPLTLPGVTPTVAGCLGVSNAVIYNAAPIIPSGWNNQYTQTNSTTTMENNFGYQSGLGTGSYTPGWYGSNIADSGALMVIISPADAQTSPALVQTPSAFIHGESAGPNTYTFTNNPFVGDVIFLAIGWYNSGSITITPPTGWTEIGSPSQAAGNNNLWYYKVVTSTDVQSPAYAVSFSSATTYYKITGFEVSGANFGNPLNQLSMNTFPSAGVTQTSPSLTPIVLGTLAVGSFVSGYGTAPTSTTSGFISNTDVTSVQMNIQYRKALTTDTSTGISVTATWGASQSDVATSIILIQGPTCINYITQLGAGNC